MDQHEPPRQVRAVLHLAENALDDQHGKQNGSDRRHAGNVSPVTEEPAADQQEADAKHGDDPHVDIDSVDDADAEPADVRPARMRPGRTDDRSRDDEHKARRQAAERDRAPPARPDLGGATGVEAPCLEHDDNRSAERDERQQEVAHDE